MRGYFGLGQLSAAEKSDILNQHKSLYNGYQTMQPQVSNTQPLYVYDPAGDKDGVVVNNKGEVKKYTNFGINEQVEQKEVCDECGAMIMDGMCTECKYGHMEGVDMEEGNMCEQCGGTMKEDVCEQCGSGRMEEETGHLDDIYKVRDLNLKKGDFDYVEGGGNDYGTFEGMHKNLYKEDDGDDFVNYGDNMKDDYRDLSMYNPYYNDDDFEDYESSYTQDGVEDPDNEDDGFEDINASEVTDGEMYEIDVKDLKKGKKYRYKSPSSEDDEIEYEFTYEYPEGGEPMHKFKKDKGGYLLGRQGVEDYLSKLVDEELYEQGFTGGGNAPDMDISNIDAGYDFKSDGPEQFDSHFDEYEVEDEDETPKKRAFDFESGGPNSGYPVFEDDMYGYDPEKMYETMESAWAEEELDEQPDISGAQGIYGAMKPAYDFDSEGPGKAGPYQEFSYESELDEQDFDMFFDDGLENSFDSEGKFLGRVKPDLSDMENGDEGEEEFEEVDEDLKETFLIQKNKINEMFNRMKRYN